MKIYPKKEQDANVENVLKKVEYSKEQKLVLNLLKKSKQNKVILMVAPSFVVDFEHKTFVKQMRGLGFHTVTEVTFGAKIVNQMYQEYIKNNKKTQKKFISSPCPTSVNLVKSQYPNLMKYLMPFDSPMIAMAKVLKKKHPKHKIVFLSPCTAKKVESTQFNTQNNITLIDVVITFKEIAQILEKEKPKLIEPETFDSFYNEFTKIYPLSGGLSKTIRTKGILTEKDIIFEDGCQNLKDLFGNGSKKVFFDILFCEGGCIGGNGIISTDSVEEKKKRVIEYRETASREKHAGKIGVKKYYKGIKFDKSFE